MPSKIEWLNADDLIGETWNILTGCDHCSDGCDHCWAARMATRQIGRGNKNYRGSVKGGKWTGKIKLIPEALKKPLHWRKPRRIFVQSMGDLFHENVPFKFIDGVCMTMAICHQHTFMILTKRPKRMAKYFNRETGAYFPFKFPLPNVHLYTSIEDQDTADERVEWLLKTPAVVHGLSIEPMLGPVDLWGAIEGRTVMGVCPTCYNSIGCTCDIPWRGIDHVIVGPETGPNRRPMELDWVRSARDQCVEAGVKFFFKAAIIDGKRISMPLLDGRTWDEMPGQANASKMGSNRDLTATEGHNPNTIPGQEEEDTNG